MAIIIKLDTHIKVNGQEQLVSATTSVRNLSKEMSGLQSTFTDACERMNHVGFAMSNISNAIGSISGTLNKLTEESRSFGGAMAAANTMAGKSGEEFANLKEQVAGLSKEIPIARDQLANGLYQVISNGVPEDNWIEYLNKSAKASVGGIANLEEVVKVTSTVIKNYGLQWDEAGSIQDKIQLTAKNGVTSFEQMAQALPRVTANAATLGVSVDELMASFATLTGVSGNTAEVSTQLAAIFTALIKPSSEATKMAQQMGIQFDAAAIKAAGGMQNFLAQLDKDVKSYAASMGMLEQEIYGKLFGSAESLRALTPLTGQLADKFNENVAAMRDSAGTMDEAYNGMANTGSATFQVLKNKMSGVADALQSLVGKALPVLNVLSQFGMSVMSVTSLATAFKSLRDSTIGASVAASLSVKSMTALNVVVNLCRATSLRLGAMLDALALSMKGATVGATTLKMAIQGLMISTGVGVAIVALTSIISGLSGANTDAAASAKEMANEEANAANTVQEAYDSTLKSTYSDLVSKYEQLKTAWSSLRTEHEKSQWIKNNQSSFGELKIKVGSVVDAENIFSRNTNAVVEAFTKRAEAAAYAAKLTELYQKQIALNDKKSKTAGAISTDAKKGGRNAKEGDVVPESWRTERYGKVGNDGQWRFTKVGAERYNGTNTSGNQQITAIDKSIAQVDKDILETKKQMTAASKSSGWITGSSASPKATAGSTPAKAGTTPKTTTEKTIEPAREGSIDWYNQKMREIQQLRDATANISDARSLNNQLEGLQRSLYMLKVKVGIETPEGSDITKMLKPMEETVVESLEELREKVKKNPINVEVDKEGMEKMKASMKDMQSIDMLGGTNLKSFTGVENTIKTLSEITEPTAKGFAVAGTAASSLGSALQQLGADSEAAKAGMVIAAIGQIALSFAQALASCGTWVEWLAFGITGTAQMISMIATVSGFAKGGIVGGSSTSGDKVPVRVNSGEMILNKAQQSRLFAIANGEAMPNMKLRSYELPQLRLNTQALGEMSRQGSEEQTVNFRLEARTLVGALANETRIGRKSGRRSKIKI